MSRWLVCWAVGWGACGHLDPDEDGLTNQQEREVGTDPQHADSDRDGYTDFQESHAGSDPLDAKDVIYEGGWPYNPDKEFLADPGWSSEPDVGVRVPRFTGVDQFGQVVDLYDYAGHGKIVALDLSTEWCSPCRDVSLWLSTGDELIEENPWWDDAYAPILDLVQTGEIYWVTVLYEDEDGGNADEALVHDWDETYPNPRIAVLADADKELHTWVKPTGIPNVNLLSDDLTLLMFSDRGLDEAFDMLVEMY